MIQLPAVPLAGANVLLENTIKGSASDIKGDFIISNVEPGTYIIKVSYIGYEDYNKEIIVLDNELIDFRNCTCPTSY